MPVNIPGYSQTWLRALFACFPYSAFFDVCKAYKDGYVRPALNKPRIAFAQAFRRPRSHHGAPWMARLLPRGCEHGCSHAERNEAETRKGCPLNWTAFLFPLPLSDGEGVGVRVLNFVSFQCVPFRAFGFFLIFETFFFCQAC